MSEQYPLPWTSEDVDKSINELYLYDPVRIRSDGNTVMFIVSAEQEDIDKIIHAANCHNELLTALKDIKNMADHSYDIEEIADAAIQLAEGEG